MRRSPYVNYYVLCLVCWILLGITGKRELDGKTVTAGVTPAKRPLS
jgi:hypothetical protein